MTEGQKVSEDHGLIAVKKDAVFHVPADGARKDDFFEIAAFADEVFDGIAVRHADNVLLDDGAVVQALAYVVGGGADELHAAVVGLVVGLGAFEAR